ncbi:hypothetical protein D3C78_1981010 [compost metagenome]
MATDYAVEVEKGLKGQRRFLAVVSAILFLGLVLVVLKLSRMQRAQTVYSRFIASTTP